MDTLNASVWLLIKEKADPQTVFDKYVTVHRGSDRSKFAWLFLYYSVQALHVDLVREILGEQFAVKIGMRPEEAILSTTELATALNEAVRKQSMALVDVILVRHPHLASEEGNFFIANPRYRFVHTPIELAIMDDQVEILQRLLQDYTGSTMGNEERHPLHYATVYHAPKCLKYILSMPQATAKLQERDKGGHVPLVLAAMHQPSLIPVLLNHGADIFATHNDKNSLQILTNGCLRDREKMHTDAEPCPTIASDSRRRNVYASNDIIYIPTNYVSLAKLFVDRGLNVNGESPPLKTFCHNVRRKLQDIIGDESVRMVYKDGISYLASISDSAAKSESLLVLCHQVMFISTQLRRSGDYDNIQRHLELLEFLRSCIYILLDNGANPNYEEKAEDEDRRVRGFQYLLPFSLPCSAPLKELLKKEWSRAPTTHRRTDYNTLLDIVIVTVLVLFPLQLEEPEMHMQGLHTILDIVELLCRFGCKCNQLVQFFAVLCVDPAKHMKFFESYVDCQSQSEFHSITGQLLAFTEYHTSFADVRKYLYTSLNQMYSLKDLLRRDIVRFLGSAKCPEKVDTLPIPPVLKKYLLDFWAVSAIPRTGAIE